MKQFLLIAILFSTITTFGQSDGKIDIPQGVVYKYADSSINTKAKALITAELSGTPSYSLDAGIVIIGPVLWSRFKNVERLRNIKNGNVTIRGYKKEFSEAKMTQDKEDFKLVWDNFRKEVGSNTFIIRKAKPAELKYYWAVISFDIEEPLFIVETAEHNYILNLHPEKLTLLWFDEAPKL